MNKLKLDLEIILPSVGAPADPCVSRLVAALRGRPGVVDAHLEDDGGARGHLCVHFDPNVLTLARVEALVRASGAELVARYGHMNVSVQGLRHERHARLSSLHSIS